MDTNSFPRVNPDFLVEEIDDEMLLFTLTSGEVVSLNPTAHLVWRLCQRGVSVGGMIEMLADAYPDQAKEVRTDVVDALETMIAHGIIELSDGG